jgi:ESS family glutamate:Na+ symporter
VLWAVLVASALLLVGFLLRARLRILQALYVPASVAGGLLGLVVVQAALRVEPVAAPARELADTLRAWPATLIAVVFAGLLLEHPQQRLGAAARGAAQCGIAVWIIVLGQIGLGLAAAWLVIAPALDVPVAFGQLLEAGFAGGHGTATALGTVYVDLLEFPPGLDLGLFVATVGLVYSVISGIVFVNIGVRRGWTRSGRADLRLVSGLERDDPPPPVAFARVRGEVIDPFVFQIVLLAMAFGLGMAFRWAFIELAGLVAPDDVMRFVGNVPLFLFTLLGGLGLRKGLGLVGLGRLIDAESVKRLVAIAMEFLIVAAIASLRIETLVTYLWPIALLLGLGAAWTAFCLVWLSPRLLPGPHWFELGILNYGMSTGTTAQGMLLLRTIDPDLESGAAEDYALAAPLSAPFVGGGVLTLSLPLILEKVPAFVVVAAVAAALVGLYAAGRAIRRREGAPPDRP